MEKKDLIEAINKTFVDNLEVEEELLKPEAGLFTDLGLDSLDMVDLMVGLQRKFKISLRQSEEMRKIVTLQDLYDFIEKKEAELRASGVNTQEIVEKINEDSGKE
ncbi:MAG: acyl carrier protein [Lentisphaeria bacterium]|nr:acyl carrier protein [Lentisphaeria bacterium]